MTEAHDEFLVGEHLAHAGDRLLRCVELRNQLHGRLVRTAVQRTAQRPDRAGDRRMHVGQRRGDDAGGERGRVEFVLGIQDQRRIERLAMQLRRRPVVQHVEDVAGDAGIVGLGVDAHAVRVIAMPVHHHRREAGEQAIRDVDLP